MAADPRHRVATQSGHQPDPAVFVTGLGVVCSLGTGVEPIWRRLTAGEVGIARISQFDPTGFATQVAASVDDTLVPDGAADTRRGGRLLHAATQQALGDTPPSSALAGMAVGVNANYIPLGDIVRHARTRRGLSVDFDGLRADQPDLRGRWSRRHAHTATETLRNSCGLRGPAIAVDTACSSGLYAIAEALHVMRVGRAECMLAGGAYSVTNAIGVLAFECLGALSRQSDPALASRPFDRDRDGFVMGEAAAVLRLETEQSIQRTHSMPLARIAAVGRTLGGATLTAPSTKGVPESAAMQKALDGAGWVPDSVDAVIAHGTSTPLNDAMETRAIRTVFGSHAERLAVSSNKGQIGHTVCAAGACSAVFAVQALRHQLMPPTAGLRNPDPACDLDYVPGSARPMQLRRVVVNAFGFGGQNACLALELPARPQ